MAVNPSHTGRLDNEVQYVKGVGPGLAKILAKVGVTTVEDLLFYFPKRYEDRSKFASVSKLTHGESACICGKVAVVESRISRNGKKILKVGVDDGTGMITLVFFNQPFLRTKFQKLQGKSIIAFGEVHSIGWGMDMASPEWEEVSEVADSLQTGRIVPIYPLTEGLYSKTVRKIVSNALDRYLSFVPEIIPPDVIDRHHLMGVQPAIRAAHFPDSQDRLNVARFRLVFEDFFLLQAALILRKQSAGLNANGIAFETLTEYLDELKSVIPYHLTSAQERVIQEIFSDMSRKEPMHRLLQGDVGSGKTLVATAALITAVRNGYQASLMAPTEILAEQHFLVLSEIFDKLGITAELLTGSLTKSEKDAAKERLATGVSQVAIGTHALIQEGVEFNRLGLVIIDEQHRFGVVQRATLRQKGESPDVLVMTATPIPRTLALTLYGDLDVSVIDELPPGRKPIKTYWKHTTDRNKVYAGLRKLLLQGRQAYIVCPLVEESEKMEVRAATELAEHLQQDIFPDMKVGLLHGQMKPREKEEVMQAFRDGEMQILAATTVIEVGVDVPNASVMLIEDADRFGLSQLHQLRGRVGRGDTQSYCVLLADPKTEDSVRRMQVMTKTSDGFAIAEEDLLIRGPGEFYGTRQHGLPSLRIADIVKDVPVLEIARKEAVTIVSEDPHLQRLENRGLRDALTKKMVDFELAAIG